MKVVFHSDFYRVYTTDPAAAPGRMESVIQVIKDQVALVEAVPASEQDILAVHTPAHLAEVRREGLFDIAALAAGGAIQAAALGLAEPCFGLIRPPGHHASADSCWGFCYFNNMAVALEALKKQGRIETAFVLDIDLHYGDGTVNILGRRPYVRVYNPSSSERKDYLTEVAREMDACRADLIGVSAGFDNHREDWGHVLETEDYFEIGRLARVAAIRRRGGCFGLLEGGYNHDVLGRNVQAFLDGLST
ncbi:MAG: histone deacetylase family protein [Thermodesulfobacteriota bacterium]